MAVGDGVGDVLDGGLHGRNNGRVVVQPVQGLHAHAVAVPQVLARQHAQPVVHVGRHDGAVGDGCALHAPLVPEDAGHQSVVGPAPGDTQAVEGAHHAHAAAPGHAALKALQVQLADGLLVGPGGDAVAPLLLVVEGKVLGEHVHTPILDGGHLHGGYPARQPAVLGVVLEIAPAVWGAVDIGPGAVDAGEHGAGFVGGVEEVLADALAHVLNELQVEGGGHHILRGVGHGGGAAHQALGEALGAVLIVGAGQADGGHRLGEVEAVVDEVGHLAVGDLADQVVPGGVVRLGLGEHTGVERAGHTHLGHSGVSPVTALGGFHHGFSVRLVVGQAVLPHLIGDLQRDGGGPGARPVAPAQVGDILAVVALILVQVGIFKQVGDGLAGDGGHGVSGLIKGGVVPFGRQPGVPGGGHAALVRALGGQDVVDGVMGVFAHGEVVIAVLQDVGLGVHVVVGGQILLLHRNGKVLGVTGGDELLVEAAQLHRGLLHLVVDIILGVGGLEVDLHGVLAVHRAGILHVHLHLEGIALLLDGEVGVLEGGVAQAVAEGEGHVGAIVILPGVALVQHIVLIPRLVVAVAHVDALLVHHVVPVALADAGVGVVLGGGHVVIRAVGIGVRAEVLHGGGGVVVLEEGVHDAARGVHRAGQDVGHGGDAGHAHIADPQHRVDAVVVHKVQLEGVGGVEQHHDLLEGALLLELLQVLQHLDLLFAQAQVVAIGHIGLQLGQAAGQVRPLAAGPGQHHQGHVAVLGPGALQGIGILAPGHLIDAVLRLVAAGGVGVHPLVAGAGVKLPLLGVDGIVAEGPVDGGLEGDGVVRGHLAGAGAAVQQVKAGLGEGGELGARGQGQGVVPVDQQGRALRLNVVAQLLFKGHEVVFVLVIAPEIDFGVGVGDDLLGLGPQGHVDSGGKGVGDGDGHDAHHQQQGGDHCEDGPQQAAFFLHSMTLLF